MTVNVTAAEFREYGKGAAFRAGLTQRELSVLKIALRKVGRRMKLPGHWAWAWKLFVAT